MLSTIGAILITIGSFLVFAVVTVVSFASVLISQLWTLGVQVYHAVAPHITNLINQIA